MRLPSLSWQPHRGPLDRHDGQENTWLLLSPDDGAFVPFDAPGSVSTAAWSVNGSGEVVGVYTDTSTPPTNHGFLLWIETDVTAHWQVPPVDLWHDRAVFHFLTDERDRVTYVERLRENLKPSGSVVIATFALDGPAKCSGLTVARYSPDSLSTELGADFTLVDMQVEQHQTPTGAHQSFCYTRFSRSP